MKEYMNVPLSVKISPAQKQRLNQLAADLNRTPSDLVREAIMALLGVYYGEIITEKHPLATPMDEGVARG